jgi:hypothetical protein
VKAYVTECEVTVAIEKMDPGILSDIGTEGVVFDSYVVYLARGTYDFGVISGVLGYYVWTETSIPGTLEAPPEGNVVELLTTRSLEEAIRKVLDVVIHERVSGLTDRLADSEEEDEEEYNRAAEG